MTLRWFGIMLGVALFVTADARANAGKDYIAQLKARIEKVKKAPGSRHSGVAIVRFEILPDGALGAVDVKVFSGHDELDAAAVSIIRRASPFPAPPDELQPPITLSIPITFSILNN